MKNFTWKWQDTLVVILGFLSLGYALVNYGRLPDQLPAQFSITGKVNTYWSKGSVIALFSFMGLIFPLAMQFIRNIDPKERITISSRALTKWSVSPLPSSVMPPLSCRSVMGWMCNFLPENGLL